MVSRDPQPKNTELHQDILGEDTARDIVSNAVGSFIAARELGNGTWPGDPELEVYIEGEGPLTKNELPLKMRRSKAFKEFEKVFGWPSEQDSRIVPPQVYETDEKFVAAFLSLHTQESGSFGDNLQNFRNKLVANPHVDLPPASVWGEVIDGSTPFIQRLYVIAPELMQGVRSLLVTIGSYHPGDRTLGGELNYGVNGDLVRALHVVYRIAGRLVTEDDKKIHAEVLGADSDQPAVTHADAVLRA